MLRESLLGIILLGLVFLLLSGCGTGKIVSTGKDTYMITGFNSAPFSSGAAVLVDLYEEADEYCINKNKQLYPVRTNQNPYAPGRPSRAELIFRCLNEDDPENIRPNLQPSPDTRSLSDSVVVKKQKL